MPTSSPNLYKELDIQVSECLEHYLLEEMNIYPAGAEPSTSNTADGLISPKIQKKLEAYNIQKKKEEIQVRFEHAKKEVYYQDIKMKLVSIIYDLGIAALFGGSFASFFCIPPLAAMWLFCASICVVSIGALYKEEIIDSFTATEREKGRERKGEVKNLQRELSFFSDDEIEQTFDQSEKLTIN
jgi:hypothetical protein